jgi:hypothetical protein
MLLPLACHSIKDVTYGTVKMVSSQGFHTLRFLFSLLHDARALVLGLGLSLGYQPVSFSLGIGPSLLEECLRLLFSLRR